MGLDKNFFKKKTYLTLISLSIFWVIEKEVNGRAFEGENVNIRDRWINIFNSLILGYNIFRMKDFRNVIDILADL